MYHTCISIFSQCFCKIDSLLIYSPYIKNNSFNFLQPPFLGISNKLSSRLWTRNSVLVGNIYCVFLSICRTSESILHTSLIYRTKCVFNVQILSVFITM